MYTYMGKTHIQIFSNTLIIIQ